MYMYRALPLKTVCCDNNDVQLPQFNETLFYREASPVWCIWSTLVVLCRDVIIFLVWGR